MKKESAEIHEYLSDNENEGSLVGADYWSTKKNSKTAAQREFWNTI